MPNQRPPTAEEAEELQKQGIDPSTAIVTEAGGEEQQAPVKSNIGVVPTIARTGLAHAGSYIGGGAGMAGAMALGTALAPETFGASFLIPAVVGAAGAMGGGYAGQKLQQAVGGESQQKLEQEANEAAEQHPLVAGATDIVGSALAGGGKLNFSNLRQAGGELLGRNTLNEADRLALSQVGEEALSPTGNLNLAASEKGKEAIGKLTASALLNPAVNTGLDLATGHTPTISGLVSQVAGGLLFSEPSGLGKWMHGVKDEPIAEPTGNSSETEAVTTETGSTSVYNEKDANGNYTISDNAIKPQYLSTAGKLVTKAQMKDMSPEDALIARQKNYNVRNMDIQSMRDELHNAWLKQQGTAQNVNQPTDTTTPTTVATAPESTEPNVTESAKEPDDLDTHLLKAQEVRENEASKQDIPVNKQADLTTAQSAFDKAKVDYQREVAYDPTSDKAKEMFQNLQNTQQKMEDHARALQEVHAQETANNPVPVGTEPPVSANTLKITKDSLLPQLGGEEKTPQVAESKSLPQVKGPGTEAEQIADDWDTKLAKLKIKDTGKTYGGVSGVSVAVWNGSIDAVRLGLKAGKAIHEAIKDGIAYIRANHPDVKFDENEYASKVTEALPKEKGKEVTTEVNRMGPLGKPTSPVYDRISKLAHHAAKTVADAFKLTDNTRDQYIGDSWNKIKSVMDKVNFSKSDGKVLDAISDWENLNHRKAPISMFRNRAQQAVYNIERQVYDETGKRRIANNEPVYRGGNPTQLKQDPFAHPTPLAPKVAEIYKNGTDTAAMAKYDRDFLANAVRHGQTPEQAMSLLHDLKDAIQGKLSAPGSNMAFFGGSRLAQGVPLPPSMTVDSYANRVESYYKRQALDNAFYKHVESNHKVMSALGEEKDAWRRPIPKDPQSGIARNPAVQTALKQYQGEAMTPTTKNEGAITNLASTLFVSSPVIEMHKILSNTINGALALSDNPLQAIKTGIAMVKGMSDGIEHAKENGVLKMTARSVSNFFDNNATVAERIQALSQGYRNLSSLGGRTEEWNMGLMQAGFESALPSKIAKAANGDVTSQQLLKKLDPTYTVGKQYDTKGVQQLASLASNYVHGTKDGRTMPPWMLSDSELSGFFKLAHWSISQTNRFMSDVYTPFTKGDVKPMLNALLGSAIGGYAIRELREKLQGKHGEIPDLKEIQASEGGLSGNKNLVAYNLISAMQYAGFAGILSQGVKYPFDRIMKNKPQGAVFPLDEIASDLSKQIGDFTSAIANDPKFDVGQGTIALMNHILATDIQLSRIAINQGVNSGLITGTPADKKMLADKLGQLRRFEMTSGLPYDDQEASQANPYMNIEQHKFKMEQDLPKAMSMLPGLVSNITKTYANTPDVMLSKLAALKQNAYETFPSLEKKAPTFAKYMDYLNKLKGSGDGDKEYEDFLRHKIVNEVKAGAVP